tara:strand:+ start:683 stop:1225 length:543 start_codon:yes stop_codon:yes gene_type:complete
MNITQANYYSFSGQVAGIAITLGDGSLLSVPRRKGNRHYDAIIAATAADGSIWGDTVPEPMATLAAEYTFAQQLAAYTTATARLAQYIVSVGRAEVVESQATGEQVWNEDTMEMVDVMHDVITVTAVEAVEATVEQTTHNMDTDTSTTTTITNPLITTDVAERAAAQATVDATPQPVKDA